jgi:hypothetical protein
MPGAASIAADRFIPNAAVDVSGIAIITVAMKPAGHVILLGATATNKSHDQLKIRL